MSNHLETDFKAGETHRDYPPLECPICGKERSPSSLNADGSVTYVCKVDYEWQFNLDLVNCHGMTYSWRINKGGELAEKQGSKWVPV